MNRSPVRDRPGRSTSWPRAPRASPKAPPARPTSPSRAATPSSRPPPPPRGATEHSAAPASTPRWSATAALNDARERIEDAATAITALAGRSQQVGGIVEAIHDIARQTNLLALNAAIEAARAGERGKGFAVVADEVRQLAERAAQSAADAGEMIAGIQGETNDAVELVRDAADPHPRRHRGFGPRRGHARGDRRRRRPDHRSSSAA